MVSSMKSLLKTVTTKLIKNEDRKIPKWPKCKETNSLILATQNRRISTAECSAYECVWLFTSIEKMYNSASLLLAILYVYLLSTLKSLMRSCYNKLLTFLIRVVPMHMELSTLNKSLMRSCLTWFSQYSDNLQWVLSLSTSKFWKCPLSSSAGSGSGGSGGRLIFQACRFCL